MKKTKKEPVFVERKEFLKEVEKQHKVNEDIYREIREIQQLNATYEKSTKIINAYKKASDLEKGKRERVVKPATLIASKFISDLAIQNKLLSYFTTKQQEKVSKIINKYFNNLPGKFADEETKIKFMSARKAYAIALIQTSKKLSALADKEQVKCFFNRNIATMVNQAIEFIKSRKK